MALSTRRIAEIRGHIADKTEPAYTAWLALQKELPGLLAMTPEVPEVWHVPPFYQHRERHLAAKNGLKESANGTYTLALAWRLADHPEHAAKAAEIIRAWMGMSKLETRDDSSLSFSYHFPPIKSLKTDVCSTRWGVSTVAKECGIVTFRLIPAVGARVCCHFLRG